MPNGPPFPAPRTNPPGNAITVGGWSPGQRYTYHQWSWLDRRTHSRTRLVEWSRIKTMTDYQLAAYLEMQASAVELAWDARVFYRAARFEACSVRDWSQADNPRI